jgi:hypothetical protein
MVRSAPLRVSNHELAAILRDAAKAPLLRMRTAVRPSVPHEYAQDLYMLDPGIGSGEAVTGSYERYLAGAKLSG